MIDVHCHLLPGIDDGPKTLDASLQMAEIALEDGITTVACTPHIYPGMYMNDKAGIEAACHAMQRALDDRGMPLKLVVGADVHLVPGLVDGIRQGRVPTLNGSRYLLLEPSHTTPPPHFEDAVFNIIASGYTPVITHPERLTWVEGYYSVFGRLVAQGAWMQVTAGSLTGIFGSRAQRWGERFLQDGLVHVLASDAHSPTRRSPRLKPALALARQVLGEAEAAKLVFDRPKAILEDEDPQRHGLRQVHPHFWEKSAPWWKIFLSASNR